MQFLLESLFTRGAIQPACIATHSLQQTVRMQTGEWEAMVSDDRHSGAYSKLLINRSYLSNMLT